MICSPMCVVMTPEVQERLQRITSDVQAHCADIWDVPALMQPALISINNAVAVRFDAIAAQRCLRASDGWNSRWRPGSDYPPFAARHSVWIVNSLLLPGDAQGTTLPDGYIKAATPSKLAACLLDSALSQCTTRSVPSGATHQKACA